MSAFPPMVPAPASPHRGKPPPPSSSPAGLQQKRLLMRKGRPQPQHQLTVNIPPNGAVSPKMPPPSPRPQSSKASSRSSPMSSPAAARRYRAVPPQSHSPGSKSPSKNNCNLDLPPPSPGKTSVAGSSNFSSAPSPRRRSSSSASAARQQQRRQQLSPLQSSRPSKPVETMLNRFTQYALPFHLDTINQHRMNIEKLQTTSDWSGVRREVDVASHNVRQLGSLLFEMEVLRSYLEPHELPYFDARVIPAKTAALVAIHGLQEMCPATPGNYSWNLQQGSGQRRSNSLTTATAAAAAAAAAAASGATAMATRHAVGSGEVGGGDASATVDVGRRHSDSETQSCHSLSYSMYGLDVHPPSSSSSSSPPATATAVAATAVKPNAAAVTDVDDDEDVADTAKLLPSPPGDQSKNLPHNPTRKTSFGEFNFDEIRTPSTVSSPLSPPPTPIFTSALLMSRIAKNRPPPSYSAALRQPHHQLNLSSPSLSPPSYSTSPTSSTAPSSAPFSPPFSTPIRIMSQTPSTTTASSSAPAAAQSNCCPPLEIVYEDPKEDSASLLSGTASGVVLLPPPPAMFANSPLGPPQHTKTKTSSSSSSDLDARKETLASWRNLEEEISDLQDLIAQFSNIVNVAAGEQSEAMSNLQNVSNRYRERSTVSGHDLTRSTIYPVAGALLGTCLGGPVGMLAGVKIGGLAAIGGSVFGYTTGKVMKAQKDRQEYIDDFYAAHPDAPRPLSRYNSHGTVYTASSPLGHQQHMPSSADDFRMKGARAQSLPDVLCDGAAAEEGERGRSMSVRNDHHHHHLKQQQQQHQQRQHQQRHHGERLAPSSPHLQRSKSLSRTRSGSGYRRDSNRGSTSHELREKLKQQHMQEHVVRSADNLLTA